MRRASALRGTRSAEAAVCPPVRLTRMREQISAPDQALRCSRQESGPGAGRNRPVAQGTRDWPEARLASWVAVRRASQAASRRDSAISWLPGGEGGVLALESGRIGGISVVRKEALGFLGLEPLAL